MLRHTILQWSVNGLFLLGFFWLFRQCLLWLGCSHHSGCELRCRVASGCCRGNFDLGPSHVMHTALRHFIILLQTGQLIEIFHEHLLLLTWGLVALTSLIQSLNTGSWDGTFPFALGASMSVRLVTLLVKTDCFTEPLLLCHFDAKRRFHGVVGGIVWLYMACNTTRHANGLLVQ